MGRQQRLVGRVTRIGIIALVCSMLAATLGSVPAAAAYNIRDLGALPDHIGSAAFGINSAGQVVGGSEDSMGVVHAFKWAEGTGMEELQPLTGASVTVAREINDAGHAVGQSGPDPFSGRAVLWTDNTPTDLGALDGHSNSTAFDINATGAIVGMSREFFDSRAVLWENGGIVDLGVLGGGLFAFSAASALNDVGQVVGASSTDSGAQHAFLWENGGMSDLGTLDGDVTSLANDINNAGMVVGMSINQRGEIHAFVWTEAGNITGIGSLPGYNQSVAMAVNGTGAVVGYSNRGFFDLTPDRAFLWENGVFTDLGVLQAGEASQALGINDAGQIVGVSYEPGFPPTSPNAVLWTPSAASPPPPLTVLASATPERTDVGRPVTLECSPDGGVPPYEVEWSGDDGLTGSEPIVTHTYTSVGQKRATCTVTDDAGTQKNSTATIEVLPLPSTTATVNHTATSPGMPLEFKAEATQGTGEYSYVWSFGDDSPTAGGPTAVHAYAVPGKYTAEVTVTDSVGGVGRRSVTVNVAYLEVTAEEPTDTSIQTGWSVTFKAEATGGAGGYTYTWDFGDGGSDTGAEVSHVYEREGTFTPKVTVTDEQGVRNETTLAAITVESPVELTILGLPVPYVLGAVLVVVAVAAVAVAIARRGRRRT